MRFFKPADSYTWDSAELKWYYITNDDMTLGMASDDGMSSEDELFIELDFDDQSFLSDPNKYIEVTDLKEIFLIAL